MGPKDYQLIFQRISSYLNQPTASEKRRKIPEEKEMTKFNGFETRISAIFVDIRNSTELFADADRDMVSRIVRSFANEVVRFMLSDNCYDIGIRGDCVYGVYSTRTDAAVYAVYTIAAQINTLIGLLNQHYIRKGYPRIEVGIGLATNMDRVVKVAPRGTGVSELVWVGEAVPMASNLSGYGCKDDIGPIVMTKKFYGAISKQFQKNNDRKEWFTRFTKDGRVFYHCSVVMSGFNDWIKDKFGL